MEEKYVHVSGREVRTDDINLWSKNAALADDRVLAELLRLRPGGATPDRGILLYGKRDAKKESGLNSTALVHADTGQVLVMPFRAIVAMETPTTETEELREAYSAYCVGSSTQYTEVPLSANPSGDPRWALVYAIVQPNVNDETATIVSKNPTTGAVSSSSVTITKNTTVTLGVAYGTAAPAPTRPGIPGDGGGAYNITLAYVWQAAGFTGATAVDRKHIDEKAPILTIASMLGGAECRPANGNTDADAGIDVAGRQNGPNGTAAGATRPSTYLPRTMVGSVKRYVLVQLALSPASHSDGDIVDDSIDWRYRFFDWKFQSKAGNTSADSFVSDRSGTGAALIPTADYTTVPDSGWGFGQSFIDDSASFVGIPASSAVVMSISSNVYTSLGGANKSVELYVDMTTGALKISLNASPSAQIFIVVEASGQYSNYGTV